MRRMSRKEMSMILIMIIISLCITACGGAKCEQAVQERETDSGLLERSNDAEYVKSAYESYNNYKREDGVVLWPVELPDDNPYVVADIQEAVALAEEGTGVLLIGSPWCRLCRMLVTLIIDALEDERADGNEYVRQIYYLDPDEIDREDPLYPELYEKVLGPMYAYMQAAAEPYTNVYGTPKFIEAKAALEESESADIESYLYTVSFWYEGKLLGMNIGTTPYYVDSQTPPSEEDYAVFRERFWEIAGLFGTELCDYC